MKSIKIALFLIVILFSNVFAQWPTEPNEGITITTMYDYSRNITSLYSLTYQENGYYLLMEAFGTNYLQFIDIDGQFRWSVGAPDPVYCSDNFSSYRFGHKMAKNSNGDIFLCWADGRIAEHVVPEYGITLSSEIFVQKFDSDRCPQWQIGESIQLSEHIDDAQQEVESGHRYPIHLEPQLDGGVLVLWMDHDPLPCYDYEGNIWLQKLDANGNKMFGDYGIRLIPDDQYDYYNLVENIISDQNGGFIFEFERNMIYVNNGGSLNWEYGDVYFESFRNVKGVCQGIEENTLFIWGENQEAFFGVIIDYDGQILASRQLNNNYLYPERIINSENGFFVAKGKDYENALSGNNCFFRFDGELNLQLETVIYDSIPLIEEDERMSILDKSGYYLNDSDKLIKYDFSGNMLYQYYEEPWPSFYNIHVDDVGNVWVTWDEEIYPTNGLYIKMNIISPSGDWGLPLNEVNEESSSLLPQNLSVSVYPNPGNGQFNISFDLVDPSPAKFLLTNVLGQRIWTHSLEKGTVVPGIHNISLDLKNEASGTYFLQVRTELGQFQQKRILLIK